MFMEETAARSDVASAGVVTEVSEPKGALVHPADRSAMPMRADRMRMITASCRCVTKIPAVIYHVIPYNPA
jgi:hypothetical protein